MAPLKDITEHWVFSYLVKQNTKHKGCHPMGNFRLGDWEAHHRMWMNPSL